MGSELCTGGPEEELEKIDYNPDEQHVDEQINKIIRKGEPSIFVAYNINNLPHQLKESGRLTDLQLKITKLMAHEKRHNKPLILTKNSNDKNFLPNPYFIRSIEAIYIGEWVLDKSCNQVVPGGLGRLYTNERIIEGEILTKVHAGHAFFDEGAVDNIQPLFAHNKEKANFFGTVAAEPATKPKSQVLPITQIIDEDEFLKMEVMLSGEGRSFTRTIEERGFFKDGLLSGKGFYHNKDGEDVYEYTGEFKEGKKNGKGIEKFKLTTYDGDFENDKKKGKGTLTLLISRAYEEERLKEEAKLAMLDKEKDPALKVIKAKDFIKLKLAFEEKLAAELKKDFKWIPPEKPPKYPAGSMVDNENFLIDTHRRTKFLEHYKGDFKENKFDGMGMYTWFNGKRYSGEWEGGVMKGYGEFFWQKGILYRGQYDNDMRHGKGEMIWSFEKRFRGEWAYGVRHGYGEFIEITTADDPGDPAAHKYTLHVKGVLFDKDKQIKEFFDTKREVDGLGLFELKREEKITIAFIKDLKIDQYAD